MDDNGLDIMGTEAGGDNVNRRVPVECYSRIVGYLRPVQNWHQGKQQEFKDRRTFAVGKLRLEQEEDHA